VLVPLLATQAFGVTTTTLGMHPPVSCTYCIHVQYTFQVSSIMCMRAVFIEIADM